MSSIRVVVAVSQDRSDLYFANQLLKRLNVVGILVENQIPEPDARSSLAKAVDLIHEPLVLGRRVLRSVVERYRRRFAIYNRPELQTDFGDEGLELFPLTGQAVRYTDGVNQINARDNIDWLRSLQPDIVAVCGTSLIRKDFCSVPRYGVLNLHGGLSQFYRGLNTTDWAVHNGEPECVGATVHFVAPGIDDGDVVFQGRPGIEQDDTPNTLYVKVVRLGVEMMTEAINRLAEGKLHPVPLQTKGPVFPASAYDHAARTETWRQYQRGVIRKYLSDRSSRDKRIVAAMINEFRETSD